MAMSDCEKCWETPCSCGHGYRDWSAERLQSQIDMLNQVKAERENSIPQISVTLTNLNPKPIVKELRKLADLLESGEVVHKDGGMFIRSSFKGIHIDANLLLFPLTKET